MVAEKKETYFDQLDGIRFIAVSLVLIDHWLAERNIIPLGPLGVTMFFVLSGFLITRILIQSKITDESTHRSHWFSVKQFIIRRSLRIFPIYYLSIFLCLVFAVPNVRETVWWCLTYTTNFYIGLKGTWMGQIDHLWSLAVEEQYYLIFPYLILFLPKKYFLKIFFSMIIIAVLLRIYFTISGFPWETQYVLMPTSLDAFGLGGLLAYLFTFHFEVLENKISNSIYLIISLLLLVLVWIYSKIAFEATHNFGTDVLERLAGAIFCFFLIAKAVLGYGGAMKWILTNPISSFLGKISYGLYLYHNFVFNHYHTPLTHITYRILHKIERIIPFLKDQVLFQITLFFGLTILVATLSWYLIEKPLNNLKRYFTY